LATYLIFDMRNNTKKLISLTVSFQIDDTVHSITEECDKGVMNENNDFLAFVVSASIREYMISEKLKGKYEIVGYHQEEREEH